MIRYLIQILQDTTDERAYDKVTMSHYFIVEEVRFLEQRISSKFRRYLFKRYKSYRTIFSTTEKIEKSELSFIFLTGDEKFIKRELYQQSEKYISANRTRMNFYTKQLISETYHEEKSYYEKYGELPMRHYKIYF